MKKTFFQLRLFLKKNIFRIACAFFIPCFLFVLLYVPYFSVVACADDVKLPPKVYFSGFDLVPPCSESNYTAPAKFGLTWVRDGDDTRVYTVGCLDSSGNCKIGVAFVNSNRYPDHTVVDYGSFYLDSSSNTYVENANSWDTWDNARRARLDNGDYCIFFWVSGQPFKWDKYTSFGLKFYSYDYSIPSDLLRDLNSGAIPEYRDTNTDNYSLDKSLGHVTNAKWKHLVSNDLKSQVVSDGFAQYGVGVDGTAKMDSYTYSRYSSFSKDKCSFATKSSTGLNLLNSRYQLQYCSRVQMTFHYNLLGVIPTDNTKDYTHRFTSPKPYPIANGCSFDAAKNIESLFTQGFAYNQSLPAFGTALRNFLFDETKYWIDVRIIDTKTKTYGAWYAMALEDNKARVITTDDGDIGSDVDSEEDVGNYTKIEGTGDTFDDAEDNSHEVKDTEHHKSLSLCR